MITKRDYAIHLINDYLYTLNYKDRAMFMDENNEILYEKLVSRIYGSTSLGIALEYLGYITPEKHSGEYEYLSNRAGTVIVSHIKDHTNILTVRELFNILPESIEEENNDEL